MNQKLLANHSTLLDLLEIPQLMDTYVLLSFSARLILTREIIICNIEMIVHEMLVFLFEITVNSNFFIVLYHCYPKDN